MTAQRARRLRLLLRDASAVAAFGAMAISGALPGWVCLLFCGCAALALLGIRPLAGRPRLAAWILVIAAAAVGALAWRGMDVVVSACAFAALLTADRMLSEPSVSADRHVLLTGLLMATGACALSGDLLFAFALVVYVPLGCCALALSVVEDPNGLASPPVAPVLRSALVGAMAALVGGCGLFAFMPRMPWHFAVRPRGSLGNPVTGFSDEVTLGGDGTLQRDGRVVIRVKISPDPHRDALNAYWIGGTFDHFDGSSWRGRTEVVETGRHIQLAPMDGPPIHQEVELLPAYGGHTLIALADPVVFGGAVGVRPSGSRVLSLVRLADGEVRFRHGARTYSYVAYSGKNARRKMDPLERKRALQLPPGLDPRIPPLAEKIGGTGAPRQVAHALEMWLRTHFRYSLRLSGNVAHPLADFLFHRKAGHCEHFATALAVLLRERGIPSRVVAGFYGGVREGDAYVLRAGDAHAWTEAWIDGGWERLDATPPDSRGAKPPLLLDRLERFYERLAGLWRSHVLDFSARTQAQAWHALTTRPGRSGSGTSGSKERWPLGLLALVAGVVLIAWASRPRSGPVMPRHLREARALLESAERLIAERSPPSRSPENDWPEGWLEERCAAFRRAGDPAALALTHLTRRWLEARFGHRALRPGERRALLRTLRASLAVPFDRSRSGRSTGPGASA